MVGLAREKLEEISNTSPQSPEGDRHRVLAHVQHQRSPTGMTPTAKHPKGREIIACDKEEGSETKPSSKRSLFYQKADDDKYSLLNDDISNLIKIPTETYLPPIVKVRAN